MKLSKSVKYKLIICNICLCEQTQKRKMPPKICKSNLQFWNFSPVSVGRWGVSGARPSRENSGPSLN